jgi:hypothetical protein
MSTITTPRLSRIFWNCFDELAARPRRGRKQHSSSLCSSPPLIG